MNTRAVLAHAVAVASGLTWAAAAAPATAQGGAANTGSDVARAEAYAADAFDAYARKDYSAAIALYQKALEAAPSADIIYNLARIYDSKLKNRGLAIEYYRRYTLDTGADPNRLRVANTRLNELLELEAIAAEQPTSGAPPPAAPTANAPTPAPTSATSQPSAVSDGLSGVQVAGIVTGAAGLAGVGLGIAFGFKAKNDDEVADRFCEGNACTTQRGVDASRDASDAATVSTISFIAGGALVLLGVTGVLLGTGTEERRAALSIEPYAGLNNLGARLATRW